MSSSGGALMTGLHPVTGKICTILRRDLLNLDWPLLQRLGRIQYIHIIYHILLLLFFFLLLL